MNPQAVGLSAREAQVARQFVGREPNDLEWGLFGALWSEHCSYKSSRRVLAWLPKAGAAVVAGPGGNAGVVRLDDEVEVAFKVESHNHPSYVEPVQGAATGVGGIIRDIVAMGARPIALMDSLRFGDDDHAHRLLNGVVAGVGGYGNAIGVPTVGGEVYYGPGYDKNPLVNVLCVGTRQSGRDVGARGARVGQTVYLLGQATGRDGIHGASLLASRDFSAEDQDMRPTVQVGDPYTGKLLMEATLAAIETGGVAAVQDLGAAGLASSSSELAVQSGVGLELDLDQVPCRELHMSAYEIMLSETQERMLLVFNAERGQEALAAISAWGLTAQPIGRVVAGGRYVLRYEGIEVANLEASWLVDGCPLVAAGSMVPSVAPEVGQAAESVSFEGRDLLAILGDPDCRDRQPIYQRYDSMIQTATVWGPEHDVAILALKGTRYGLCLAISGPGRWAAVDAYAGGRAAVALVVARLATQGAVPLGLTDGLNLGNPDKPEVKAAFEQMILGIREAALALDVPVTGGNVSFHNETDGQAIWPTPVIGGVGRRERPTAPWADGLSGENLRLILVNPPLVPTLGGSVGERFHGKLRAYPRVRLQDLARSAAWLRQLSQNAVGVRAVRAVADGGVWLAVVKMWLAGPAGVGVRLDLDESALSWPRLLCEEVGQFLVAVDESHLRIVIDQLALHGLQTRNLGQSVAGTHLTLRVNGDEVGCWPRQEISAAWRSWEGERGGQRTS